MYLVRPRFDLAITLPPLLSIDNVGIISPTISEFQSLWYTRAETTTRQAGRKFQKLSAICIRQKERFHIKDRKSKTYRRLKKEHSTGGPEKEVHSGQGPAENYLTKQSNI